MLPIWRIFAAKLIFAEEIRNLSLEPETVQDYQAGVNWKFGVWGEHQVDGKVAYFYDRYFNLIDRVDVQTDIDADGDGVGDIFAQRQNVGRAVMQGVAISVGYAAPHWVAVRATLDYTRGDRLKQATVGWIADEPLRRVPPLSGTMEVRIHGNDRWHLTPQYHWSARQERLSGGDQSDLRIPVGGTPGFHVFPPPIWG